MASWKAPLNRVKEGRVWGYSKTQFATFAITEVVDFLVFPLMNPKNRRSLDIQSANPIYRRLPMWWPRSFEE